jgi:hypothetical protein
MTKTPPKASGGDRSGLPPRSTPKVVDQNIVRVDGFARIETAKPLLSRIPGGSLVPRGPDPRL